jgi:peptidoglycan hydrolase-like protein with peptidoglycan-binding domain
MRPLRQAAGRGQGTRCRRSLGTSLIGIANLSGLSHHGEGIMTESAEQVTLNLPQLKKNSSSASDQSATARIQHIFNDFAKANHETPRPFQESGDFGAKTEAAVKKFQRDNHIPGPDGVVRHLTWAKLLERWVALPPDPVE